MGFLQSIPSMILILLSTTLGYQSATGEDLHVFNVHPCSSQDTADRLQQQAQHTETRSAVRLLSCAESCGQNERCLHAVFFASTRTCGHVNQVYQPGGDTTGHEPDAACTVLSKTTAETPLLPIDLTPQAKNDHASPVNDSVEITPMKVVMNSAQWKRIYDVTHVSLNDHGPTLISSFQRGFYTMSGGAKFDSKPLRNELLYFVDTPHTIHKIFIDIRGNLVSREADTSGDPFLLIKRLPRKNGKLEGLIAADSLAAVRAALLNGYRRVERYPTRCQLDQETGDVHFDMTETFRPTSLDDVGDPIYFTSIKESMKDNKRYLFRHRVNQGSALPAQETEATRTWVMDTAWSRVESQGGGSLEEALMQLAKEGKELRLVMGDQVCTDVVVTNAIKKELRALLPSYLVPFEGQDSKDAAQRVRFPVVSTKNTLVECEMAFQNSTVYNISTSLYPKPIQWFVSTRNWTKVMTMNSKKRVVLGSHESLHNATLSGKSIRVCVVSSTARRCVGTASVMASKTGKYVIVQTLPIGREAADSDGLLSGMDETCYRRNWLISSGGWVRGMQFVIGGSESRMMLVAFQSISWFVEFD